MALTEVNSLGIKDLEVKTADIAADAVTGAKIGDDQIDSEHYVAASIDHEHLANDCVDGDNLADNACDSEHYTDGSIDHAHLANDCVDGDNIADNSVTLAHMAGGTDGQIITYDASGDPVAVGPGTDGQVLTSTGAGSPPAFEDAAGGGKILQVVHSTYSTESSATNTEVTTGLTCTITPSAATSKIYINFRLANCRRGTHADAYMRIKLYRGDAAYGSGTQTNIYQSSNGAGYSPHHTNETLDFGDNGGIWLDSPSTTSATTYTATIMNIAANGVVKWSTNHATSSMVVMEVSA